MSTGPSALATEVNENHLKHGSCYHAPHLYAQEMSLGAWKPWRWLSYLGMLVAETVRTPNGRLIVNAPPRFGKSELLCHWTPTWLLDVWPEKRVILSMYQEGVASEWGRLVRNELNLNPMCRTKLDEDTQAKGLWKTQAEGGMVAVGVGGALTARGGDVILIDDPIKNWDEAYSLHHRRHLVDWFNSTLYTRREPGASIIVLMARWHEDDLCGYLIEEHADPWKVVRLPALAEADDPLGRNEGESLCPERFTRDDLLVTKEAVTQGPWDALYQQNPQTIGLGRAYMNFSPARNVDYSVCLNPELPLQLSIDFNIRPGMHMIIGQHDPARDLFTAVHEIHGPRMDVIRAMDAWDKLLDELKAFDVSGRFRWKEVHVFGDSTGLTPWVVTSESCYQQVFGRLQKRDIPYRRRVPKGQPPVKESLDAYNDALRDTEGKVHYLIHPRCVRLLTDMRELRTDESGLLDKTDYRLSHSSDAERYRVHYLRPMRIRRERQAGRFSVR